MINILTGTNRGCLTINIIASPIVEGREELILFINEQNLTANVLDGDTTVIITSDGGMSLHIAYIQWHMIPQQQFDIVYFLKYCCAITNIVYIMVDLGIITTAIHILLSLLHNRV